MEDLTKYLDTLLGGGYVFENGKPYYTGDNLLEAISLKTNNNVSTIKELQISVDEQLAIIESRMTDYKSGIKDIEDLTVTLQDQIDELKKLANDELMIAQIDANKDDIDYLKLLLGIDRVENSGDISILGKLEASEIVGGIFKVKVVYEDEQTIGEGKIEAGDNSVEIETKSLTENSKVFVTPRVAIEKPLAVTEVEEGESFTVELVNITEKDIEFDWWVVEKSE